ncbi:MAG: NUDIX domain-containing protein [Rhodobacteraceae bacterium]|nr:NUDIX domain-containing protein [Paracoccaceae bacterium]
MRPIVIGLFYQDTRVLVAAVTNDDGSVKGWRPLGGGIDFGETAESALRREMTEELGATITQAQRIGVMENHYSHGGKDGHEIVFVYRADFQNTGQADADSFILEDQSFRSRAEWRETEAFRTGADRLLPDGLIEYL